MPIYRARNAVVTMDGIPFPLAPAPRSCLAVLIPDPFAGEVPVMVEQPPPDGLGFPIFIHGAFGQLHYRRTRCVRADHTGVVEAHYTPINEDNEAAALRFAAKRERLTARRAAQENRP